MIYCHVSEEQPEFSVLALLALVHPVPFSAPFRALGTWCGVNGFPFGDAAPEGGTQGWVSLPRGQFQPPPPQTPPPQLHPRSMRPIPSAAWGRRNLGAPNLHRWCPGHGTTPPGVCAKCWDIGDPGWPAGGHALTAHFGEVARAQRVAPGDFARFRRPQKLLPLL